MPGLERTILAMVGQSITTPHPIHPQGADHTSLCQSADTLLPHSTTVTVHPHLHTTGIEGQDGMSTSHPRRHFTMDHKKVVSADLLRLMEDLSLMDHLAADPILTTRIAIVHQADRIDLVAKTHQMT